MKTLFARRTLYAVLTATAILTASPTIAGPFILAGTDADDHGFASAAANLDGWLFMQRAIENLAPSVTNGSKTVVSLGSDPTATLVTPRHRPSPFPTSAPPAGLMPTLIRPPVSRRSFPVSARKMPATPASSCSIPVKTWMAA